MRNSLKVAKWEIKRNLTNKSFIISLLSTPVIFLAFLFIPMLFDQSTPDEPVDLYVYDELGMTDTLQNTIKSASISDLNVFITDKNKLGMQGDLAELENSMYLRLTEDSLKNGQISLYITDDLNDAIQAEVDIIEQLIYQFQINRLGLTPEQQQIISKQVTLVPTQFTESEAGAKKDSLTETTSLNRIIPGVFAGIILFSIVMTGMMIFQSASQEKKEKVAEIILSSLTSAELMQGKIIGYFVLGITQVVIWFIVALPALMWRFDFQLVKYLLVPETFLFLFIAFAGYLLFAAIFVGIGATVEDMTATSNFQGIVMMLPFLPFVFIKPLLDDPNGTIATIGSFIPITAPSILIYRLTVLEEWPWLEIGLALIVLVCSVWVFIKLAGKIFNIGILMYGKNASPKEIWKWMWQ